MDEYELILVVRGFQEGGLDEVDLAGMIEDYEAWVAESSSWAATRIRERRAA